MDATGRERRAYSPLELDDRSSRKLSNRRVHRTSGASSSGFCFSLQSILPEVLRCWQPGLQVAYDALEEDYSELEQRYGELARSSEQGKRSAAADLAESQAQLQRCQDECRELQQSCNSLAAQVAKLQEERLATASSLAAMGSKAAEDRVALEEATVAITSLTQQIELAQQENSALQKRKEEAQRQAQDAQAEVRRMEQRSADLTSRHAAAMSQVSAQKSELEREREEQGRLLSAANAKIADLTGKLSQEQQAHRQRASQADDLMAAHADAQARVSTLEQEVQEQAQLRERMASDSMAEVSAIKAAHEEDRGALAQRAAELERLAASAAQMSKSKIEGLEEAVRRERAQREKSEAAAMDEMSALREQFQIERGELGHRMADAEELAGAYAAENKAKTDAVNQLKKVEAERDEALRRISGMEAEHNDALDTIEQYERIMTDQDQQLIHFQNEVASLTAMTGRSWDGDSTTGSQTSINQDRDVLLRGMSPLPEDDLVLEGVAKVPGGRNGHQNIWDSAADIARPGTAAKTAAIATSGTSLEGEYQGREEWQAIVGEGTAQGWLLTPDEVERKQEIGRGSFGTTYLGKCRGASVAVKCARIQKDQEATNFLRELKALTAVRHPNIMALQGAVIQPPSTCWLVADYLPGGTLAEWLYGKGGRGGVPRRTMVEKLKMGLGIARGMLALQQADPPVLHRDLKPANVLLDSQRQPKIADFGLARQHLEDEAYSYTGETGTYTYMSPEMMRGDMYGPATDVFSFAILMAEILRQRPPYEEAYLTPVQVATAVADDCLRPQLASGNTGGLKFLLEMCWGEAELRPGFDLIVEKLEEAVKKAAATAPRRGLFS